MAIQANKRKRQSCGEAPAEDFDNLVLRAMDQTLSILGELPKATIYFYIKKNYGLDKEEIPRRIDEFSEALEHLFKSGAFQLENLLVKNLCSEAKQICAELSCDCTIPKRTLRENVEFIKQQFEEATER